MPNWCSNDLTITGPKVSIQGLMTLVKLVDGEFDFNGAIPYPSEWALADAESASARDKGDWTVKDGFNNGGYDWCIEKWGTKWNASDVGWQDPVDLQRPKGHQRLEVTFETAWAPPEPVIKALGEKFPDLKFKLRYYEGGMGYQGSLVMEGGEVVKQTEDKYSGQRGG